MGEHQTLRNKIVPSFRQSVFKIFNQKRWKGSDEIAVKKFYPNFHGLKMGYSPFLKNEHVTDTVLFLWILQSF